MSPYMHNKMCSKSGVMDHKKFESKNFSTVRVVFALSKQPHLHRAY